MILAAAIAQHLTTGLAMKFYTGIFAGVLAGVLSVPTQVFAQDVLPFFVIF
jgi:hypothetical protein